MFYHGSETEIINATFTQDLMGSGDSSRDFGFGLYLTTSLEQAQAYGPFVYSVELNPLVRDLSFRKMQRPIHLASTQSNSKPNSRIIRNLIERAPDFESTVLNFDEIFSKAMIKAVKTYTDKDTITDEWDTYCGVAHDFYQRSNEKEFCAALRQEGIDGALFENEERSILVVANIDIIGKTELISWPKKAFQKWA